MESPTNTMGRTQPSAPSFNDIGRNDDDDHCHRLQRLQQFPLSVETDDDHILSVTTITTTTPILSVSAQRRSQSLYVRRQQPLVQRLLHFEPVPPRPRPPTARRKRTGTTRK